MRDRPEDGGERNSRGDGAALVTMALTAVVRFLGFLLLVLGLWALVTVLFEAVGLYRNPDRIEAMVVTIERSIGLPAMDISRNTPAPETGAAELDGAPPAAMSFRPAYFLGWFLAILLFLVIGKLADWLLSRGLSLASFRCGPGRQGRGSP